MSADDAVRPPHPELVPTLTEVVDAPPAAAAPRPDPDDMLDAELQRRVDAAVERALRRELPRIEAALRRVAGQAAREAMGASGKTPLA